MFLNAARNLTWAFTWTNHPYGDQFWRTLYNKLDAWGMGGERHGTTFINGFNVKPRDSWAEIKFDETATPKPVRKARRYREPRADQIIHKLLARGYYLLGSGAYSSVYVHDADPDFVIKVSKRPDDWPTYVKWGHDAGYAGTFTPKIVAMKVFTDGCYIAKMERLKDTLYASPKRADLSPDIEHGKQLAYKAAHGTPASNKLDIKITKVILQHLDEERNGFGSFMKAFGERFTGCDYDMHPGNWMTTDGDRFVLTDPLTNCGYTEGHSAKARAKLRVKATSPVFVKAA
jgi:hypothetical protein